MSLCSALNCNNDRKHKASGISFHRFPLKEEERCKKWVIATRREPQPNVFPTENSFLCSNHFDESCFRETENRRGLHCNAVPSIFSFSKDAEVQPKKQPRKRIILGELQIGGVAPTPKRVSKKPGPFDECWVFIFLVYLLKI